VPNPHANPNVALQHVHDQPVSLAVGQPGRPVVASSAARGPARLSKSQRPSRQPRPPPAGHCQQAARAVAWPAQMSASQLSRHLFSRLCESYSAIATFTACNDLTSSTTRWWAGDRGSSTCAQGRGQPRSVDGSWLPCVLGTDDVLRLDCRSDLCWSHEPANQKPQTKTRRGALHAKPLIVIL
jgi:hypothetical protein